MPEQESIATGTEPEIIKKLQSGELDGIVVTPTHLLVNLRVTGTGETIRQYNGKEYIFNRPAGVFLSEKFLERCNGLPVLWGHPTDGEMGYENFKEYMVGTVIAPYLKLSEVWAVCKIFDLTKLNDIMGSVSSTSPFVTSANIERSDGKIDEGLEDINHVAIVPAGHWDSIQQEAPIKNVKIFFKENMMPEKELEKKDAMPLPHEKANDENDARKLLEMYNAKFPGKSQQDKDYFLKKTNEMLNQTPKHDSSPAEEGEDGEKIKDDADPTGHTADLIKGKRDIFDFLKDAGVKPGQASYRDVVQFHEMLGGNILSRTELEKILNQYNAQNKVDNGISKDVELPNKTDQVLTGGEKMVDVKKEEAKKEDSAVKVDALPIDKKVEDKKPDCADDKKDALPPEVTPKAGEDKKDADPVLPPATDDVAAGLKAEIETLKAEIAKLKGTEGAEGKHFEAMGSEHEVLTKDDDEKEQMVNAVSELADSAHSEIVVKRPAPKKYESKFDYVRRVLTLNKGNFDSKFDVLLTKVDSSNFALAKDALGDMEKTVKARTLELNKKAKGAVVAIKTPDGAVTDINYGRK